MSYTTVQSQQITSKDGELSIDVFNDLNQYDNSKLILNCNSYLNDGIKLNCPGGGISLNSQNITLKSIDSKIQTKKFNIETVDKINISSLESVNISALNSISLSNQDDGIFYNIDKNTINIFNGEKNSIFNLISEEINIGDNESNIVNTCNNYTINYNSNLLFKRLDKKIIHIHPNDNIEIKGDVYINGTLKFDKLESAKIKKIKLEDSHNKLEFGNDKTKIFDWAITGRHVNADSELRFDNHSNTYMFKKDNNLSNLKAGGLCINYKGINVLEVNKTDINLLSINTGFIKSKEINVENMIRCGDIEIRGKKIIEHLGNIINKSDSNIENIIRNNDYVFFNCDLNYNISIDKEEINLAGYHKNIIWSAKLNLKNINKYSTIKNIIFRNAFISTVNCNKLKFINCQFENTKFFSQHSDLNFVECLFDINCEVNINKAYFDKSILESGIKVNEKFSIFMCELNYNSNNKIILENKSVIYHITNNYITCRLLVDDIFSSGKDIILNDNWINTISSNKSEYQKNTLIKTKNTM